MVCSQGIYIMFLLCCTLDSWLVNITTVDASDHHIFLFGFSLATASQHLDLSGSSDTNVLDKRDVTWYLHDRIYCGALIY